MSRLESEIELGSWARIKECLGLPHPSVLDRLGNSPKFVNQWLLRVGLDTHVLALNWWEGE